MFVMVLSEFSASYASSDNLVKLVLFQNAGTGLFYCSLFHTRSEKNRAHLRSEQSRFPHTSMLANTPFVRFPNRDKM